MKIFLNKIAAVFVGMVFVLNVSGCATYKMHPEFKERHKTIKSVAIMPPQVEAYVLTFKGDRKMLTDLMPIMGKTTVDEIEKILSNKGYEIKKLDLTEDALKDKPDLRTSIFHINELFKKQLEDIAKNKKPKFTYTLGSDVNTFANLAECDILIFVKEDGVKKSAGEIAKDVAKGLMLTAACLLIGAVYIPIPQTAATVAHVAIVDGNDGSILWYNNNVTTPNWDPENQKHVALLIKNIISPFPDSVFKQKGAKTKIVEKVRPVSTGTEVSPVVTGSVVN